MRESLHYVQWLGTVHLTRTSKEKHGLLYGIALLSIDRDRPHCFSLKIQKLGTDETRDVDNWYARHYPALAQSANLEHKLAPDAS
jgi:hypothetical protein